MTKQTKDKMPKESEEIKNEFPKRVGIIYIENPDEGKKWNPHLDFDQDACSYFLTRMNAVQSIFDFQIITINLPSNYLSNDFELEFTVPQDPKKLDDWFERITAKLEEQDETHEIDYLIYIASTEIPLDWFFTNKKKRTESGKLAWIITSNQWQKLNSPPSLFEYLAITVITCALYGLDNDFRGTLEPHESTKGCIFDFTTWKKDRRILISNPQLCYICKTRIQELETKIRKNHQINLLENINRVLSKEWMGSSSKRDTPMYNLKKNYSYDVDFHSGFYKKPLEIVRDYVKGNALVFIVSTVIFSAITLLFSFFSGALNLESSSNMDDIKEVLEQILDAVKNKP